MREHQPTDYVIPFSSLTVEDPEGRTVDRRGHDVRGKVEFRMSLEDVEGILKVADAFAAMQHEIRSVPVAIGPLIGDSDSDRIRSNPTFRLSTGPFFRNLRGLTVDGEGFTFEEDWTDVIFWDDARGITFRTPESEEDYTVAVGLSREDLELHLEASSAATPR